MKAAVQHEAGGPEVLHYEDIPDPAIQPDQVLVRVEAISIEGGDPLHRAHDNISGPHVVGYQCAGTVIETGAAVAGLKVGERVVTVGLDGSHAELRAVPEAFCWTLPDELSTEDAACIPVPFGTADDCLFEFGRLTAGEVVLVHAGAGGVGIPAIQLAKQAGALVLATASRDDKLARLAELGLDHGINYREGDFVAEVRRLTDGRGADVILESVGGDNLQRSLQCLAYRGRCVSFGDAGRGSELRPDISSLRPQNQTLVGYFLGAELFFRSERARPMIERLIGEVAAGRLRVVIDSRYPLAEAAAGHARAESREAFGRVLLVP